MKSKSTSLARKALASPTFVARQPRLATGRDGTDLPMPANGSNLTSTSPSSGGCRLTILGKHKLTLAGAFTQRRGDRIDQAFRFSALNAIRHECVSLKRKAPLLVAPYSFSRVEVL